MAATPSCAAPTVVAAASASRLSQGFRRGGSWRRSAAVPSTVAHSSVSLTTGNHHCCVSKFFLTALQSGISSNHPTTSFKRSTPFFQTQCKSLRYSRVDAASASGDFIPNQSRRFIVLDIEGTTSPISFVTDVLFPYARDNVRKHLVSTYESDETKDDIKLLRSQVEEDLIQGVAGAVVIPSDDAGKENVIDSLVSNVEAMIKADRKITSLKQLQGHIWRTGFREKDLLGVVFDDVPVALEKWYASGKKVYIYSSGSREAQRLIFGNTTHGDLRKYLCGFFDTIVGGKREARSYFEISQYLGVDEPSEILFLTDVYQEAIAAKAAGFEVIISVRSGNFPLPDDHGFRTISSFSEI